MGQTTDELRDQLEDHRASISRDLVAIEDRVLPGRVLDRRKARARQGLQGLRDRVMGRVDSSTSAASDTVGSARDSMSSMKDSAGERLHEVAEQAGAVPDMAREQVTGAPLVAGGIAFGAGLLLAAAFPATQRERQVVSGHEGDIRAAVDEVKSEARDAAQGAVDHLRPQAEEAAGRLKDQVAGSAEHVQQEVASTKDDAMDQAARAAGTVKDAATG
jgi:ElaB/YqjD/DUF883 family membrane-anchored ribosome-binding protein